MSKTEFILNRESVDHSLYVISLELKGKQPTEEQFNLMASMKALSDQLLGTL